MGQKDVKGTAETETHYSQEIWTMIYGIILSVARRYGKQKQRKEYLEAQRVVFLQRHEEGPQNLQKKWLYIWSHYRFSAKLTRNKLFKTAYNQLVADW
jgi:hypothetical protein